MASKHICPKCGNTKTFITVAHVVQQWLVNQDGEHIETIDDELAIAAWPRDENIWTCSQCGAEAKIVTD